MTREGPRAGVICDTAVGGRRKPETQLTGVMALEE